MFLEGPSLLFPLLQCYLSTSGRPVAPVIVAPLLDPVITWPGQPPPSVVVTSPAIGGCQVPEVSWARLPVSVWAGREQSVVLFEFCGNQEKCDLNINRRVYLFLLQSEKD